MSLPPLPRKVRIVEVGPRDGLQNEPTVIGTSDKIGFVDRLSAAGLPVIEVSAFVSPLWVPQLADATEVFAGIRRRPGTRYTALVPNEKGLRRAIDARVDEIAIFGAVSETFSRRNINQSIDASLATYREVCTAARDAHLAVRGYLSTCFGCPFEGAIAPARVAEIAKRFFDLGVYEIVLSDTIGVGHPALVERVVESVAAVIALPQLALHFHDTRGMALANVLTGLRLGIATFDASAGGLGGCQFAPGATGNVATEDVLYMLNGMGIETGASLEGVMEASAALEPAVGRPLPSRYYRASRATPAAR